MSSWSAGYTADIEYLPSYFREQTPRHLALACALGGVEAPALDGGYRYCELGCGLGFSLNLLAAADKTGQFVGIDFNPAHIARARSLATAAGIENVSFHETSFAELIAPGDAARPGEFDIVVLHGVYSWVSRENRQAIVEFLRRSVKPGGLVYISYNAMPGWASTLPFQRLVLECAAINGARSDRQLEAAIDLVRKLQAADARHDFGKVFVDDIAKRFGNGEIRYLAHEYVNRHWEPVYFSDVARALGEAKLSFVGSAALTDNFDDLSLSAEQRQLLATVPPSLRETVKDYCVNRRFRRDVFVRGARRLSDRQRNRRLEDFRLALIIPRSFTELKIKLEAGEASLSPQSYTPIFDALAAGPRTVRELLALPALREARSTLAATELAGVLVGTGQAAPVREAGAADHLRATRFNEALAEQIIHQGFTGRLAMASALLGGGISVLSFEPLIWAEIAANPKATAEAVSTGVMARLAAAGEGLIRDGKPVAVNSDEHKNFTKEVAELLAKWVPLWRSLAIL